MGGGQLVFTQQPSDTRAGNIMNPVTVRLANSGGAPVTGVPITLSLENSGVPLVGTLTRTTDATGQAVFTDLSVRVTGTYRLTANALTVSALSNSFQITAGSLRQPHRVIGYRTDSSCQHDLHIPAESRRAGYIRQCCSWSASYVHSPGEWSKCGICGLHECHHRQYRRCHIAIHDCEPTARILPGDGNARQAPHHKPSSY